MPDIEPHNTADPRSLIMTVLDNSPQGDAVLTALKQYGYAVVPVEPTAEMRQIGGETNCPTETLTSARDYACEVWRAMVAAAGG